jgi:DNA-directed RNA polymerase subunit RPC12/RpoP
MPIRFRCVYCKQLMGISRRKAGTVVRCPKCTRQVMVPMADDAPSTEAASEAQPIFERSDFDDLIQQAAPEPAKVFAFEPAPPITESAAQQPAPPETEIQHAEDNVEKAVTVNPPSGLLLSPTVATTLAVCVIIGLAIAFVVGLFIGFRLRPHEPAESKVGWVTHASVGRDFTKPL